MALGIRFTEASFNQMGRAGDALLSSTTFLFRESCILAITIIFPIMSVIFKILLLCRNSVLVIIEISWNVETRFARKDRPITLALRKRRDSHSHPTHPRQHLNSAVPGSLDGRWHREPTQADSKSLPC
jgi:hypothetical protein